MIRTSALGAVLIAVFLMPSAVHADRSSIGHRLLHALDTGAAEVNLVVAGDSTGDEESEWVYQLALALERRYPAYTVNYYLWDRKHQAWPSSPDVFQWGSGASTLNVWNMSVSGSQENYARAYAESQIVPKHPDLLLVSYGHNDGPETARFRWGVESLVESVAVGTPETEIALIAQNPERDNSYQDDRAAELAMLAAQMNLGFVNVWGAFENTGDPGAYLEADGIHPNGAGYSIWLATVLAQLGDGGASPQALASRPSRGISVIQNGDFSVFARGQPKGWVATNVRASKDYGLVEQPRRWALRLTQTGGSTASFSYPLNANWLKGKWVTVAVRIVVPDQPGARLIGRVGLVDDRTDPDQSVQLPSLSRGRYYWEILSRVVDPRATKAALVIYVNQQAGHASLVVDRVLAVLGTTPPPGIDDSPVAPRPLGQ
jgi:lysophospholipase L1-like esterase